MFEVRKLWTIAILQLINCRTVKVSDPIVDANLKAISLWGKVLLPQTCSFVAITKNDVRIYTVFPR